MSEELDNIIESKPRPGFLTVLCVLSFISTGFGLVSGLFNVFSGPSSSEEMLQAKVELAKKASEMKSMNMQTLADIMNKLSLMTEEINDNFYLASIISLIIVIVGLYGVFLMWKGIKQGFHFYIVYCLLTIASIYIYVSPSNIPSFVVIINLLLSGLFILMYSRNLKWMK